MYQFMNDRCGLVNTANPCRCSRKAQGFIRAGWLDAANLQFTKDRITSVQRQTTARLEELEGMDRLHAGLYRTPPMLSGPDLVSRLRDVLSGSGFGQN